MLLEKQSNMYKNYYPQSLKILVITEYINKKILRCLQCVLGAYCAVMLIICQGQWLR